MRLHATIKSENPLAEPMEGILRDTENDMPPEELEGQEAFKEAATFFKGRFRIAMDNLPTRFLELDEHQLNDEAHPTPADWRLRLRFTEVVRKARLEQAEHIPTARVYEDVCSRIQFEEKLLKKQHKVAFITRPVVPHAEYYEALNRAALDKAFLMLKNMDPDPKHMGTLLKLAELSANRAYGAVTQRMQIQSKNLNVEVSGHQLPPPEGREGLQEKIAALQAKLLEAPKDVTPVKVDDDEEI